MLDLRIKKTMYDKETGTVYKEVDYQGIRFSPANGLLYEPSSCKTVSLRTSRFVDLFAVHSDLNKIITLCNYTDPSNNHLKIRSQDKTVRPASEEDISVILKVPLRAAKEFLRRMKKLGVIRRNTINYNKIKTKVYIFNPYYVNAGKRVTVEQYFLFEDFFKNELSFEEKVTMYKMVGKHYKETE